ncbi:Large terminase phage packaging protein [Methylorubrum salsuginis]|uniref:Large terminase phage packaging protein n=2 Tax=Methylorubrum salsuginis TaxID=414703 RepID=A0A1I4CG88_9HYPH|nr:Large terminase phage packaging protein [Methylorubrum salsuginis]
MERAALPSTLWRSVQTSRDAMLLSQQNDETTAFLANLPPKYLQALDTDWLHGARCDQLPPPGDWTTWAVIGGRGSGKTRTGAEWVRGLAHGDPVFTDAAVGRIALIGETFADVRDVMIEGPSGLLGLPSLGHVPPAWQPSRRRLVFDNGAVALAFSAEEPDSLRGPQFGAAWSDEIAKWREAEAAYDMIQFGLRLGKRPRGLVTTTPRPVPLIRRLLSDPRTVVTRSRTADNAENLAPVFLQEVVGRYAGTRLGRQELDGELIEDRPDALWTREGIERARVGAAPVLQRIAVAVDPPASSRAGADACGIVAAGLAADGTAYVLADATLERASPAAWARAALALYHRLEADALVAEVNQGGEMVTAVLAEADANVPVLPVRATRGKMIRAEPVSLLYAQGRVRHVGPLPALEDEMCDFGPGGLSGGGSPDRLDALVWAITHLMLAPSFEPRVRRL